jgi:hypothetical protein
MGGSVSSFIHYMYDMTRAFNAESKENAISSQIDSYYKMILININNKHDDNFKSSKLYLNKQDVHTKTINICTELINKNNKECDIECVFKESLGVIFMELILITGDKKYILSYWPCDTCTRIGIKEESNAD